MPTSTVIALLSDFGIDDTYVAAMKAVILSKNPSAHLLDLTHAIHPGDLQQAAFELWRIRPYLPEQTVVVAVVDPGVGTSRKPVAIDFSGLRCVGPDNGLFSYLLETEPQFSAVELHPSQLGLGNISSTFHGRDLFAPAGAAIASGTEISSLGPDLIDLTRLPTPTLKAKPGSSIQGELIHIDNFGNLISSIGRLELKDRRIHFTPWLGKSQPFEFPKEQVRIHVGSAGPLKLMETFGAVESGNLLGYIGSAGLLEIAVSQGHAARTIQAQRGDPISIDIET
jgi:S-adenosylmethionine hydrolase